MDDDARFWALVKKSPGDGCWEWTGAFGGYGTMKPGGVKYGLFVGGDWYEYRGRPKRRLVLAHRWAYARYVAPIPKGLVVMHKCDNGPCVRPDHLAVGTQSDNVLDMYAKGRDAQARIRGDNHYRAEITSEMADAIRDQFAGGTCREVLALEYGICVGTVNDIILCKSWKHTPGAAKHGVLRTRVYGPTRGTLRTALKHRLRDREKPIKLTPDTADAIRDGYAAGGVTIRDLALRFNVGQKTVHDVLICKTWRETEGANRHGPLRPHLRRTA
jgi:hypothetical protein